MKAQIKYDGGWQWRAIDDDGRVLAQNSSPTRQAAEYEARHFLKMVEDFAAPLEWNDV